MQLKSKGPDAVIVFQRILLVVMDEIMQSGKLVEDGWKILM